MCPFCVGTALWMAAGVVGAGGVGALAVGKLWKWNAREREEGGTHDEQ